METKRIAAAAGHGELLGIADGGEHLVGGAPVDEGLAADEAGDGEGGENPDEQHYGDELN